MGLCCPSFRLRQIVADMVEKHRNHHIRGAELRQVTLRRHDLHDGLSAEIHLQIFRHHNGRRQVLGALNDVAGHRDVAQDWPHVELEYGLRQTQRYVRSHVE